MADLVARNPSGINTQLQCDAQGVLYANGGLHYETVAAGQSDQAMGATGAAGDYLHSVVCVVSTAATSTVQIKDGSGSAITILPANVGAGIGTYTVELGLTSVSGAWKLTTGAGVAAIGIGRFT